LHAFHVFGESPLPPRQARFNSVQDLICVLMLAGWATAPEADNMIDASPMAIFLDTGMDQV
jgi:hypothetical protein